MKTILITLFSALTLLTLCPTTNLEARMRTSFGVSFNHHHAHSRVYAAPVYTTQPVYVAPSQVQYVNGYPVVYQTPVPVIYPAPAPVVYQQAPTYVYSRPQRSTGFSFSFGNFWR